MNENHSDAAQPCPYRFRKSMRVRKSSDFEVAYQRKCKAADGVLLLFATRNAIETTRLGLSVSRKRGPAVQRNRQKRLLREAFRLIHADLPRGLDLIAIPIHSTVPNLQAYRESLLRLARKLDRRLKTDFMGESSP